MIFPSTSGMGSLGYMKLIIGSIWSNLKNLTGDVDDETMAFTVLYNFLGAQNALSTKLKDALFKDVISAASPGGKKKEVDPEKQALEDLIVDMINVCAQMFEVKSYTKPEDKHMLLKVRHSWLHFDHIYDLGVDIWIVSVGLAGRGQRHHQKEEAAS